jgi:hypothetical protein
LGIGCGQGKGGRGYGLDLQVERKISLKNGSGASKIWATLQNFIYALHSCHILFVLCFLKKKIRKVHLQNEVMVVSVLRIPVV